MGATILKVIVHEGDQEEPKVQVTVPLKLAKWALKLLPLVKNKIETEADIDIDFNALYEMINEGFTELEELGEFTLVKIQDGNTRVLIGLE